MNNLYNSARFTNANKDANSVVLYDWKQAYGLEDTPSVMSLYSSLRYLVQNVTFGGAYDWYEYT